MYYYEKILRELYKRKVKYLLVGGMAVNLHGFERSTADVDIILLLDDRNLVKFIRMVRGLQLKPKVPVQLDDFAKKNIRQIWIHEKNMKAFNLYDPKTGDELDVIIDHPVDFEKVYRLRKRVKVDDYIISLIPIDDLIKMKKVAQRARDQIDIGALLRIKELGDEKKKI